MTRKTFTKEEIEQLKNKCDELDKTRTGIVKQLEQVEASIALSKVELFLAKNQYNKGDVIKIHVGIGSNRKERILCVPFDEDYDEVSDLLLKSNRHFWRFIFIKQPVLYIDKILFLMYNTINKST